MRPGAEGARIGAMSSRMSRRAPPALKCEAPDWVASASMVNDADALRFGPFPKHPAAHGRVWPKVARQAPLNWYMLTTSCQWRPCLPVWQGNVPRLCRGARYGRGARSARKRQIMG